MNIEPFQIHFHRQDTSFFFWPSKGIMEIWFRRENVKYEFDMKDVFFLHGWIGSMIVHYISWLKKGNSEGAKEVRKLTKKNSNVLSKGVDVKELV